MLNGFKVAIWAAGVFFQIQFSIDLDHDWSYSFILLIILQGRRNFKGTRKIKKILRVPVGELGDLCIPGLLGWAIA